MSPNLATPRAEWPPEDRMAWEKALAPPTSVFEPAAVTANWSEPTIESRERAFANWVGFLRRQGHADIASAIPLITPERLNGYVVEQRGRANLDITIGKRLEGLHAIVRIMAPERDFGFIVRPGGMKLSRMLLMRPRRVSVRDTVDIIEHVQALHRGGLEGKGYAAGRIAIRDAALIGLIACRPERIRAISRMQIGRHLVERGGRLRLVFEEEDLKPTGHDRQRKRDLPVPDWLRPILDDYIGGIRPELGGRGTGAFWVSTRGGPAACNTLSSVVRRRTEEWFGKGRGPHWLRKCFTTTVAVTAPELLLDAAVLVGHGPQVQLDHYNMSNGFITGSRHNDRIEKLKEKTASIAAKAYG